MSISLSKGQRVDLTKGNPSLKNVLIGLGWDANQYDGEASFDLDASAFLLNNNDKCPSDSDIVFYGNLQHPSKAIIHQGDNRTGDGDGDDEVIQVSLDKIPEKYSKIVFTVTIYDAEPRLQNGDITHRSLTLASTIAIQDIHPVWFYHPAYQRRMSIPPPYSQRISSPLEVC